MNINKRCKATQMRFKDQRPQYRVVIPNLFADILGITDKTEFDLTLLENKDIMVRMVDNDKK